MSNTPDETLKGLLETAKGARLSPADEEQAFTLLKQTILEGKKGLPVSLEALTVLPWNLGVKAVSESWPELKPTTRRQFLAALTKTDSDQAKRMRLSIARGLFPLDQPTALKLILGFCAQMDPANPKDRQNFTNVLIGKTKPWILNLPLQGLKAAEATSLVNFTLAASQQTPAFTQIWIFGWLEAAGLFSKLAPEQIQPIAEAAKRWQPKWQKELKKAVPTLPEPIEEALKQAAEAQAATPPAPPQPQQTPQSQQLSPQSESGGRQPQESRGKQGKNSKGKPAKEPEKESEPVPNVPQAQQRPEQKAPTAPPPQQQLSRGPQQQQSGGQRAFDLQRALGEISSYVGGLKTEIQQLKAQSRQRESRRPEPREREHPTSEELENLRRHNLQLEETAEQLRRDIEELISDHEDRATILGTSDEVTRFKALLGVKLGKDYFDFEALRRESATEVVRRHLGDLLDHIFEVLKTEGVEFKDQE